MIEPDLLFSKNVDEFLIPVANGQAVDAGWTAATHHRPMAVTWHWTATTDLASCDRLLGGPEALRKGIASAHYGVGRSFAEGVHRYVTLDDRSWHAGKNQTLRWDGRVFSGPDDKGARTAIGVETVHVGYARQGFPSAADWLRADSPHGRWSMRIPPWPEEQIEMMIAVGKEIVARWPHIGPEAHHGHHDLCPGYKVDVSGFPFARVLRGIYEDPGISDVWTPFWTVPGRLQALIDLGYASATLPRRWDDRHDDALRRLQAEHGLVVDGMWTTFVSRKVHALLAT